MLTLLAGLIAAPATTLPAAPATTLPAAPATTLPAAPATTLPAAPAAPALAAAPAKADPLIATCDGLRDITTLALPDWRTHPADLPHGEAPDLDDARWRPLRVGERWSADGLWVRRAITLPRAVRGYDVTGARVLLHLRLGWNVPMLVYRDGALVQHEPPAPEPIVLADRLVPGSRVVVAVKLLGGKGKFGQAELTFQPPAGRPSPADVRAELLSAAALLRAEPTLAAADAVRGAAARIDFRPLWRGDQPGFDASLRAARARLEPLRPALQRYPIYAVGNSHIDMAWLWPATQTEDVVRRTFQSVLQLMREYPELRFSMGSAQAYLWIEEHFPDLFEQIRRRVAEGRWEIVGGTWVEPDLNLPDGESLARQLLLGLRYFRQRFGVEVRTGWAPDSFGYSWQVPQLLRRAGMDSFVTHKLSWNDTTRFPHKLFRWQAPDGSEVLTYLPHEYDNDLDPVRMAQDLADSVAATGQPALLHLFGVGDHGGGPTRVMLDEARRFTAQAAAYPTLRFASAQSFFDELARRPAAQRTGTPVWRDELYLEYHRGAQTSQARTKQGNRTGEARLLSAERFAALAAALGGPEPYPQEELTQAWRKLLFNQFHDILAGTGTAAVHRDAARDHDEVLRLSDGVSQRALQALSQRVRTAGPDLRGGGGARGLSAVPVVIWNPLPWARGGAAEVEVVLPGGVGPIHVLDPGGADIPAEVLATTPARSALRLRVQVPEVPPLGYTVLRVLPGSPPQPTRPITRGYTLENQHLRVTVDPRTGCITSLVHRATGREALSPGACGNALRAFRDEPRDWDAWNLDADFEQHGWDLPPADAPGSVVRLDDTPVGAAIRVVRRFRGSVVTQDLVLARGARRLDLVTEVDWHERHVLLKAAFPAAPTSDQASFEIPFGVIRRPTTRRTPAEQARFEVPALRYADVSDGGFGVSLLSDSRSGYDVKGSALRLSLLRGPAWPDPLADEGRHRFTYAIYPHAGGVAEGESARAGYELSYGLYAVAATAHGGALGPVGSLLDVDGAGVILSALKRSEDGDGLVLRLYEHAGRRQAVRVTLPVAAASATEVDLQERDLGPAEVQGRLLRLTLGPYEIRTVKIRIDHRPARPAIVN